MFLLVIEVVTGEYGNFTSQLKTAALDNAWRTPQQITDSRNINYLYFLFIHGMYRVYFHCSRSTP